MSPVDGGAWPGRRVLLIWIGSTSIETGVRHRLAGAGRWIEGGLHQVEVKREDAQSRDGGAVLVALQGLEALWHLRPPVVDEVRVMVADRWLAVAGIPWSAGTRGAGMSRADVVEQLKQAGFGTEAGDSVSCDDAPFEEPRLAAAYPAALTRALEGLAARLGARLVSVLPLSVTAWSWARQARRGQQPSQALLIWESGSVMFARAAGGGRSRLADVTCRAAAGQAIADQDGASPQVRDPLLDGWRRLCLRDPQLASLPTVDVIMLSSMPGPAATRDATFRPLALDRADGWPPALSLMAHAPVAHRAIDAVAARRVPSWAGWLGIGLAASVAALALLQLVQTDQAVREMQRRQEAARLGALKPPAAPPLPWRLDELPRVQAVNTAIREMNMPIGRILLALEPPADIGVAVLSVETSGTAVKIGAQARSGSEMARYVAFVSDHKPFVGAYLTRHEVDANGGDRPYRFTMEASWKP